jgi:hypothetical protein
MSYGLSVWNSSGALQIDSSRRYLRVSSVIAYTFQTNQIEIVIAVPGFTSDGSWFASCITTDSNNASQTTYEHKLYTASTGQVGIKFAGRYEVVGLYTLVALASTGSLTIFRV